MTRNSGGNRRARRARRLTIVAVAVALATVSAIAFGPSSVSSAFPQPGTNVRVSPPLPAAIGDGDAFGPAMSHDGRFVAYLAPSPKYPADDAVYLKDRNSAAPPKVVVEPDPIPCKLGGDDGTVILTFTSVAVSDDGKTFAMTVAWDLGNPPSTPINDVVCEEVGEQYVEVVTLGSAPIVAPLGKTCTQESDDYQESFTTKARLDGMSADGKQVLIDTTGNANAVDCPRCVLRDLLLAVRRLLEDAERCRIAGACGQCLGGSHRWIDSQ